MIYKDYHALWVFAELIHCSLRFTDTTGFVDKLFECLTTKNYLGNPAAKEESKIPVQKLEEKEEVKSQKYKILLIVYNVVKCIWYFYTALYIKLDT